MATDEELLEKAPPLSEQLGPSDVFVGISGLTNAEALRAAAETLPARLGADLSVTIAYPGFTSSQPEDAVKQSGPVRLVSYALPASEGSATPWAIAAGSQRAVLALAAEAQAKVCVLLHPDLKLLTGGGLESLAIPVLEKKAELVLPVYAQGRYDNLLNNSILAPLTRALYGKRARYPLASDYAVSSRLVARLLQSAHTNAHVNAGSILWPATVAATIDAPVAEAVTPMQHAALTEGLELSAVIAQLAGSAFADMDHNAPLWQRVRGSQVTLTSGQTQSASSEDGQLASNPDPKHMVDSFLLGYRSLQEVWGLVLPPVTLLELKRLTLVAPQQFRMPDELWVRIIYDFAMAFRLRTINRTHLLGALTPLYLGWVASYVNGWNTASPAETTAQRHEQLAKAFEDGKPYLVRRWRWPDRFNP